MLRVEHGVNGIAEALGAVTARQAARSLENMSKTTAASLEIFSQCARIWWNKFPLTGFQCLSKE
jgi:hypothetical protein